MVADIDIGRFGGDTVRTLAFATYLSENGVEVKLVVPKPSKDIPIIDCSKLELHIVDVTQKNKSFLNLVRRRRALIKEVKLLKNDASVLLIETSVLGGYFAISGFSGYILDVHGIAFDEVKYAKFPWYAPKFIYTKFINAIEIIAVKRAAKVVSVSQSMSDFIHSNWGKASTDIAIIPNGYFEPLVSKVRENCTLEETGMVSFVGLLVSWANIDKIIDCAYDLRNEKIKFYIIGGGDNLYISKLKERASNLGLENVVFTGSLPIEKAYDMICKSQVLLLPFPKSLCTEVANPIKVLEYMAFGKAMVMDEVCDLSKELKNRNAAIVTDQTNNAEFTRGIKELIDNEELRTKLGKNAESMSHNFPWGVQGKKLYDLIQSVSRDFNN